MRQVRGLLLIVLMTQSSCLSRRSLLLGAGVTLASPHVASAAAPTFQTLFWIERSKNANVVSYDAVAVGPERLDDRQAVIAYWIMRAEDGHREELTALEQRAYGFRLVRERIGESYLMVLRAAPDRSLRVTRFGGRWIAQATIEGKSAILERMFVASDDSGLIPRVRWIDLIGHEIVTKASVVERLVPR